MAEAKKLKHEADKETNMIRKSRKYLKAIMVFCISGTKTEAMGDQANAFKMYNQTIHLVKFVMKLLTSKNFKQPDIQLVVMALRAQALLNMRLYKMRRCELKDSQSAIQATLEASQEVTFPKKEIQDLLEYSSYLTLGHELWEQAEVYASSSISCRQFCLQVDGECGALTLTSGLEELVAHTRRGLAIVEGVGGQRASRKVKEDNQTREGIKEEDTEDKESLSVDSKMKMEYIEMDDVKQENLDPSNAQGCMNANSVFKK